MVVAFCGHASYVENPMDENRVLRFLENEIRECAVEFFLGEYGAFDSFVRFSQIRWCVCNVQLRQKKKQKDIQHI